MRVSLVMMRLAELERGARRSLFSPLCFHLGMKRASVTVPLLKLDTPKPHHQW